MFSVLKASATLQCANLNVVQCNRDQITADHPEPERYLFCGENRSVATRSVSRLSNRIFSAIIWKFYLFNLL